MRTCILVLASCLSFVAHAQEGDAPEPVVAIDPALYEVITASKDDANFFYGYFVEPRVIDEREVNYLECGGATRTYRWVRLDEVERASSVTDCEIPPIRWAGMPADTDDMVAAGGTDDGAGDGPGGMAADEPGVVVTEFVTGDLAGAPVYDLRGVEIGAIDELVVGDDGVIGSAVIGIGGFLGLGEEIVSVPFESLTIRRTDDRLRVILEQIADGPPARLPEG